MKRVVIVGGTGNISTSITRLLVREGYDVTCFNRGLTHAEEIPGCVRLLQGDRNDRAAFEELMLREAFDYAIDMICYNGEDAQSDIRAFRGVKQLVYTSTACVYGVDYDYLPVDETHPLRPITPYGTGKAEAEGVFMEAWRSEGFPVTIIRPSSTYGNQVGLVGNVGENNLWIDRVRKGKPILLCGSGNTPHQLLHVDDAAKGYVGTLGKEHCLGRAYNLVREGFITWRQFHETGMRALGRTTEMVCVPLEVLEALGYASRGFTTTIFGYNTIYDHRRIYHDIPEFRPTVGLEEGMRGVIAYSDAHGMIPDSDAWPMDDMLAEYMLSARHLTDGVTGR
ncbi:MAG: NAD-dependent epimerase/dehydratase family protein [Clostridia bacterium]|nr:NAD-dependent epimerase/dehydratase family protein [Clostridia bacterium]